MENIKAHSNKTELWDRTLWYDGDSSVPSDRIQQLLVPGVDTLFVDKITKDIEQYNKLVQPDQQIRVKQNVKTLEFDWNIPDEYKNLNVHAYVVDKFVDQCDGIDESEWNTRALRISQELNLYQHLDLYDVLRTIIYIINTLDSKNVVWGVGRGSSVSSYVLYLIGVHDVDSVKYELDINDFLRVE